jgi:type I restriction enzyme S subunit
MSANSGWTRVAFGDVVRLVRERSSDPEGDGFERYVGLEHIEPGDLRIRRWGNVSEGTTFTNVFHAGQVLFGKRRAYQRKVALADFDGVCSGDIYVFEAKDDGLLPELLPFICQSDRFFDHAVGTSAGSLSPRTNWNSLAEFEFPLPPLDEQQQMAIALDAILHADEAILGVATAQEKVFASSLEHLIGSVEARVSLEDVAAVERGQFSHRPRNLPEFYGGDAEFVQTGDVAASRGVLGPASQSLSDLGRQYSKSFPPGTILLTIAAVIGATALTDREIWCPDSVVGVIPDTRRADPRYLELALRRLRPLLDEQHATTSTQKNINLGVLRPLRVPLPSLDEQRSAVATLQALDALPRQTQQRRSALRGLTALVLQGRLPA